jgi:hypothetical protein
MIIHMLEDTTFLSTLIIWDKLSDKIKRRNKFGWDSVTTYLGRQLSLYQPEVDGCMKDQNMTISGRNRRNNDHIGHSINSTIIC